MVLGDAYQKPKQLGLPLFLEGEAPRGFWSGEASTAAHGNAHPGNHRLSMEMVVDADNMKAALKRVRKNKGSPGIDGMTVDELKSHLVLHWPRIRAELLDRSYQPMPVKLQEIKKDGGGIRKLGIPTVLDRLIQQAILQVLQPEFDPTFSESSFGFRPGRGAHGAVLAARDHIQAGLTWVVDVDLAAFFDRVNHDILMERLSRRISDKRILGLIRRFLTAEMMANGVALARHEGTPQGGPLSPLLANVLLDEVDKELEKRSLAFCRYADDCNVYVASKRAGKDVFDLLKREYAGLQLSINEAKSAVDRPWNRKFLGYTFHQRTSGEVMPCIAEKSLERMREKVRSITARTAGRSMDSIVSALKTYLSGWRLYFSLTKEREVFRKLDRWIRQRLRVVLLVQWKRGTTVFTRLQALGAPAIKCRVVAAKSRRPWHITSHSIIRDVLPDAYFNRLGVPMLSA